MEITLKMTDLKKPLVSVIIAFLNEERFLAEAIDSVLAQDYLHWQLLLVDDGSTDNSTGIAQQYAKDSQGKIIYLEHDGHINRGLSASRNLGIMNAKGGLIAFLDADDVWLPCKLSNQVKIFQQNPAIGMIAEASDYWYSWNDPEKQNRTIPVGATPDKMYDPPQLLYALYPLGKGAAPCPTSLILTADAIKRSGNFEETFNNNLALYEDQAFLSKIYLHEKVYISSACNNRYRQRQDSIVRTVRAAGQYDAGRFYFLNWLESFLHKSQIDDKQLQLLLKKAKYPYQYPTLYFLVKTIPDAILKLAEKYKSGMKRRLNKIISSKK